jgi:hypothetical protein
VMFRPAGGTQAREINVMVGWDEELKRLAR